MKRLISIAAIGAIILAGFTGCGVKNNDTITVISREEGSGTRSAFVELVGVEEKDSDGNKSDKTSSGAIIAKGTDVVITKVSGDGNAIGYISLGSVNESVKAIKVDSVEATFDNVKNGSYNISRPFNIATKGDMSDVSKDFVNYIMSKDGQQVVADNKYIPVDDAAKSFTSDKSKGKIVVGGSSSVSPVMEKLAEAYKTINTNAEIEIQTTDSTSGMKSVMDGTCDIGMASRELKDTESGLTATAIALDGIALIVNKDSSVSNLTMEQIKSIYKGEKENWADFK